LSVFPSQVDPHRAEGGGDAPEASSSLSIGELWPDIDKLDEINHGVIFMGNFRETHFTNETPRRRLRGVNKCASPTNKRVLMDDAPGPSSVLPRGCGCGRGSASKKATQILVTTPRAILPHMWRSFVDRQYSPSTGMN
jgi:hypothetical protein